MNGLMMDMPLLISDLIKHADRNHGETEIVSKTVEGNIHRYTYRDAHARARRLARVLQGLGVKPSDRVGTLAWNGYRHYELYYAISGIGGVINTLNPRLFPEQLTYISNHAENSVLFFELTFVPLLEKLAPLLKTVKHFVLMTDRAHMPASSSTTANTHNTPLFTSPMQSPQLMELLSHYLKQAIAESTSLYGVFIEV